MLPSTLAKIRQRQSTQKKSRKKPPKWLYPWTAEREYNRDLLSLTNRLKELIKEYLLPEIPSMIYEVERKTPNDRSDDYLSRLETIIIFLRGAIQNKVESTITEAEEVGVKVSIFNRKQFQNTTESVFGINLFIDEPWLADQLKLFSSQNAQLIRSLPDQELERVAGIVERGLQDGKRYSDVAKDIQKSFGISNRRAKLIARDQTKKLNSSLTKLRQQEIGVTEYIWQTSGDERVRPTHAANDGKKFKWDKPPATGHPGEAVNCRCTAIAVLDNILDLG